MYVCLHSCLCSVWEYTLLLLGLVLLMYSLYCGSFRKLSHGPSARNRGLIRASDFCLYSCPQKFFIYICLHVSGQCSSAQMHAQLEWQKSFSPLASGSTFDPTSHTLPILLFHFLSFASVLQFRGVATKCTIQNDQKLIM